MGDKYKITRPEHSEHPELTGRQVGDKCEIMRPQSIQSLRETSGKQMGHKYKIMRPEHSEHPELTGRQVSCGQSTQSIQSLLVAAKHSEHPELTGRQVETNGREA